LQPDALARFIAESPLDRPAIFAFVERFALSLAPGSRVLDVGAGDAPYRSVFAHCEYVTTDWSQSAHSGAQQADIIASADQLPVSDGAFDAVITTQVLEHVADPAAVLHEARRVLGQSGILAMTAPFVWELHEEPHDYFRYTKYGLQALLGAAGFSDIQIEPLTGYFSTVAQMIRNGGSITGLADGGLGARIMTGLIVRTVPALRRLDRFDRRRALPLGWGCIARAT
jgi:SAM-dependent methyltransferase